MEEKSRVILYEDLRKQISNIDNYSFSRLTNAEIEKNEEKVSVSSVENETNEKGIKRNTLTLSIEELLDDNRKYDSHAQEKEMKRKYQNVKREGKKKVSPSKVIIWVSVSLVVVAFLIFIILVLLEVF